MRTIVTGGAGFVGSHLVELLLKRGHSVLVLDSFFTGRSENLDHLRSSKNLEIIEADVSNLKEIKDYFIGFDWVFHLAALADIVPSIEDPYKYYKNNVDGTASVLEASRKAGINKFIYAASSSCYGKAETFPTPETAPTRPEYPYALTKLIGEEISLHYCKVYKLPVVSLRMFNVYGPRARTSGTYGAVFGVFLSQKLSGKPYTVVGDGTQTRDFVFVEDVVNAFLKAAESNISGSVFNVGSGSTHSINRVVELLGGGDVIHLPKRPGEPNCTFGDISKIKKTLGWKPKTSIEEGVSVLLDNIDYWRDAPVWTSDSICKATKEWFKYLE